MDDNLQSGQSLDSESNKAMDTIVSENQFLRAAAHGLSDKLKYAESLLEMALEFMVSIDYETAIDAAQCVAIATSIGQFLGKVDTDE